MEHPEDGIPSVHNEFSETWEGLQPNRYWVNNNGRPDVERFGDGDNEKNPDKNGSHRNGTNGYGTTWKYNEIQCFIPNRNDDSMSSSSSSSSNTSQIPQHYVFIFSCALHFNFSAITTTSTTSSTSPTTDDIAATTTTVAAVQVHDVAAQCNTPMTSSSHDGSSTTTLPPPPAAYHM
jgi:hypothetical protein